MITSSNQMALVLGLEDLSDGVLLITLNRPDRKNAFNAQMWRDFHAALREAQERDAVRAVVVTGMGDAFSAGQDLNEMQSGTPNDDAAGLCMHHLYGFDKPLIAAVNGVAVGFGLTFLLHCDYVYIARGACLRAPFVNLGVVPEAASSYLLPLLIGYRKALDVLFEAEFIGAQAAVEIGLATHVCEGAELLSCALERARRLRTKPLGALRATKRLLLATRSEHVAAADRREVAAMLRRLGSPEHLEAVTAFFEKRSPNFTSVPPTDREE